MERARTRYFLLLCLLILLLGYTLRMVNAMQYPVSLDETRHIARVHLIVSGENPFAGLDQNKWLYGYILSRFNTFGPEGPWVARWLNVMWAMITTSCCIGLANRLHSHRAGLFAGLIYAVGTMAVFFERRALVDPQTGALCALVAFLSVSLAYRPRWWVAVLTALALTAARLTKPSMFAFLVLPFVAAVLFNLFPESLSFRSIRELYKRNQRRLWYSLALGAVIAGFAIAASSWVYTQAANSSVVPRSTHTASFANTTFSWIFQGDVDLFLQDFLSGWRKAFVFYFVYWMPGITLMLFVSIAWMVLSPKHRRGLLYAFLPGILFLILPIVAIVETGFQARYTLINGIGVAAFAALGLVMTIDWLHKRLPSQRYVSALLVGALFVPPLYASTLTWFEPQRVASIVPYPLVIDWVGTHEFWQQGTQAILEDAAENGVTVDQQVTVLDSYFPQAFQAYLGPRNTYFARTDANNPDLVPYYLQLSERVYVVEEKSDSQSWTEFSLPDFYREDYDLRLLAAVPDNSGDPHSVFVVEGVRGEAADRVYAQTVASPESMRDDYVLLSGALGDAPVHVFPANHAELLPELTETEVHPLSVDSWPMTPTVAAEKTASMGESGERVDIVVVDEVNSDPEKMLITALHDSNLYSISHEFFGLLHLKRFLTGPADPAFEPVDVSFENVVFLDRGVIIDQQIAPGDPIRVALEWHSEATVSDPFSLYSHVYDLNGNFMEVQRDGVPGDGLYQLALWTPDITIPDRYVINTRPDLPPGIYEVRVGVFNPGDGLRLPVTQGDFPDYAVVGTFEVVDR